jgi:FXSXX-COOH protein
MSDDLIDPGDGLIDLGDVSLHDLDQIDEPRLKEAIRKLLDFADDGSESVAGFNNRI